MQIIEVRDDRLAERWAAYVKPRTPFVPDLLEWRRVVDEAYGIKSHFLAAVDGDRIVGTLGLFEVKHPIFGHYLATALFANDGGLYFDDAVARDALATEARALAGRLGVSHLSIRTRGVALDGFRVDRRYRSAVLDLDGGADSVWERLPSKTRNQVRRGMKEGFIFEAGLEQREAFYDVFHRHMRELGSPAHGRPYYESITRHLGACVDFLTLREGNVTVAGALLFWINGTAMNYHTVALREYNRRCPNYLIYWRMIEASCARGCRSLDMGRSEANSSNLRFKSNWAPREIELDYNYFLLKLKDVPYLDPRNPKFTIAIAVWRHLPLFVTKALGPRLIAGLA
jgi:FemAB-related protein (PEP-CTERM system-associated)